MTRTSRGLFRRSRLTASLPLLLAVMPVATGCAGPAARDIWEKGLARCASNDTLDRDNLVFLGPSNPYGPGSGWRMSPTGSLDARFSLERAIVDPARRALMVRQGKDANCNSLRETQLSMTPSVALASVASDVQARLGINVQRDESVDVRVDSWRLDRLEELLYEEWMVSPDAGRFGQDLLAKDRDTRYVMKNAVAVKGFRAVLKVATTDQVTLDGSLPLNAALNLGGSLQVKRITKDQVEITSADEFYVVATFAEIRKGAIGAFGAGNGPVDGNTAAMPADIQLGRNEIR